MTIKLDETYVGRVDTTDPDYQWGKGRNIQGGVPNTGTPFDEKWFNDFEGKKQALLRIAGIVPSGVSDSAVNSDQLEAMKRVQRGFLVGNPVGSFRYGFEFTSANDVGIDNDGNFWKYSGAGSYPITVAADTDPTSGDFTQAYARDGQINPVGNFSDGVTFNFPNDAARDAVGEYWVWTGALPYTATAGTVPSKPDYEKVFYNSASNVNTDDGKTAQDTHNTVKAILVSQGLSGEYGYFADGFTLNDPLDVGIDASYQFWRYVGAETLPYAVPASTDPSTGDWELVYLNQVIKGGVEIKTPTVNPDTHMLFQPVDDVPIRVHFEPKGYIDNGVVSKLDLMGTPYDLDPVNYNICNLYLTNGDPHGTGEGTVIAFNAKGVGNTWGLWPSVNFGFQDLGENAVCAKMWYGDHNQPAHYTPNKGNWREGKSFSSGDYATNNNDIFRAATTGVAGNAPPTHTSGTVSDGNIDWEFIYSPNFNTVRATYMFGDRADMPVLGHSDCRVQFKRNYLTAWGAQHKWLNSDGDLIFRFLTSATSGGENEWMHFQTFGGGYERWHRTENYKQTIGLAITESAVTYNSGETNLDLSGVTLINFGNTAATTVNTISNVKPNQLIKLESANKNTTIQNSSTIRLIGNQDITLDERTAIFLIADTTGSFLKQIGNESGSYKPVSVTITYNDLWDDADADPANSVQCLNDRGVVSLSGRADPNGSASTQIGTLPTGYRPIDRDAFVVTCDDAGNIVRLQFTTSGQILTNSIQDGIAFDGVTFVVDR